MSNNPFFYPNSSSDEVYFGQDLTLCLTDVVNAKADADHTHSGYAVTNHNHDNTYSAMDHTHSDYAPTSHTHPEYETSGAAINALTSANAYTDSRIDILVGEGASTTLDTIGEISSAIEDNQDAVDILNAAIGNKANASDLTTHTGNKSNPHNVTLTQLGVNATATELNYIDGVTSNIQTQLNSKAASSHNHDSVYINKDLQMTDDDGDVSISWSGKDTVAQFKALGSGMYTAYAPVGNTNNPNSGESFRFMIHKTGTANYGWVMAYGGKGSVYTGYIDNGNWKGWKALWEYAPAPLWSGGANGGYYMTAGHTITPTKKLSECRNGWALLWSDYDPGGQANNTDFYVSYIYKRAYTGQVWGGGEWYCDIPSYSAGTATDSEQRVIKLLQIYDAKIVGTENNAAAPRNDVVLRAVYEF